jgi:hypothetical protein
MKVETWDNVYVKEKRFSNYKLYPNYSNNCLYLNNKLSIVFYPKFYTYAESHDFANNSEIKLYKLFNKLESI